MFHDDEFDRIFKQMSGSFMNLDNVFEMLKNAGNMSQVQSFMVIP